jgi:ornithine cyclodeaminase
MLILDVNDIKKIIQKVGIKTFLEKLIIQLKNDFSNWNEFEKVPRAASHSSIGVIELMPISNKELYSYKYVNGHPQNHILNKPTVMAMGALSYVISGEPILISEMTLLTALRTGATSALAGGYLAKKDSSILTLIGTGAQSEFQSLAFSTVFDIKTIRYFDIDEKAMDKFEANMAKYDFELIRCKNSLQAVKDAHIITTITADKTNQTILTTDMINKGVFINGVGGDCPGKTELQKEVVENSKVVVEYTPQTKIEGEIQQTGIDVVYCELHELIKDEKKGRINNDEITLFDSVGFALEDFSVLKLVYDLAQKYKIGKDIDLLPNQKNPKNLFGVLDE